MPTLLRGRCHCGNLRLQLEVPGEAADLPARACLCSFCQGRRARWTSAPAGHVELAVEEEPLLSRYRFGTETADFLICARCGTHVAATCEVEGALYAVINLDCIEALRERWREEEAVAVSFEGEEVSDRLARRKRGWTLARWRSERAELR